MSRTPSSRRWLKEHLSDPHVKLARQFGFRSRAVFKLIEINKRDRLLRPGITVIDLGAAPGSWSQIAAAIVGSRGRVIAVDIQPVAPLTHVTFIQGDLQDDVVVERLLNALDDSRADLVLSDIAPNITGMKTVDQARMMKLAERVLECATLVLKPGGHLLVKVFQGEGFETYVKRLKQSFQRVYTRKPLASRGRSSEVYVIGRFYSL